MSTVNVVLNILRPGDWAFKLDLQDTYLHIPLHPAIQKYLRFAFQGTTYQFRSLPFGLNTAPMVFAKLFHVLPAHLPCQGISVIPYIDDWIFHLPDRQVLLQHRIQVLRTLELAGFLINEPKSQLIPSQDIQFLGIRFNLLDGYASIPPDRHCKLRTRPLQVLFQQAGLLNSLSPPALVDSVTLSRYLQP
jgi:hypothetical protein